MAPGRAGNDVIAVGDDPRIPIADSRVSAVFLPASSDFRFLFLSLSLVSPRMLLMEKLIVSTGGDGALRGARGASTERGPGRLLSVVDGWASDESQATGSEAGVVMEIGDWSWIEGPSEDELCEDITGTEERSWRFRGSRWFLLSTKFGRNEKGA